MEAKLPPLMVVSTLSVPGSSSTTVVWAAAVEGSVSDASAKSNIAAREHTRTLTRRLISSDLKRVLGAFRWVRSVASHTETGASAGKAAAKLSKSLRVSDFRQLPGSRTAQVARK